MTVEMVREATQAPAAQEPEEPSLPSLSPSRAADFKTCPLLFRFRTIDRLPEVPSPDQVRGTLVHAVLERLFDLPAAERTPHRAAELVGPEWERLRAEQEDLAGLFTPAADTEVPGQTTLPDETVRTVESDAEFLASATSLLQGYFAVEDPRRLEPAERETLITATVEDRLVIRGYVDRLDVSPTGEMRVVDYKTGGAPREAFEARALFQMKFYALVLWRVHGVVPRVLRLLYLRDAEVCDYSPDAEELLRFERTLLALWEAIERAKETRDFRPRPSRLCGWCAHQAHCPAFGGSPPPYPPPRTTEPTTEPTTDATSPDGPPAVD
jgi:putative RecB family exonuclease